MSAFKNFSKLNIACIKHGKASGGLLSEYSVGNLKQRQLKVQECSLCIYKLSQLQTMTGNLQEGPMFFATHN